MQDDRIVYYDDELDSDPSLQKFVKAIREGSGYSQADGLAGLHVEQHFDPAQLIAGIERDNRKAPRLIVLDIATQSTARQINGELDGGYAVARAAVKKWRGVALIFHSYYEAAGDAEIEAEKFFGYRQYIWKRGNRAADILASAVRRALGFTDEMRAGRLTVLPKRNQVKWNDSIVDLTDKEFRMVDTIVHTCLKQGKDMATYGDLLLACRSEWSDPSTLHPIMSRIKDKLSAIEGRPIGKREVFLAVKAKPEVHSDGGYKLLER